MASLQGLPPLPKSLSGLLNFSSAQWKELERLHTMRTMIQQDLSRGSSRSSLARLSQDGSDFRGELSRSGSPAGEPRIGIRTSRLDAQLALLRKEMVGLRQLDMSLLCQLMSLNESIQEYKQLLHDRLSSPLHSMSPGWDNGLDSPSSEEPPDASRGAFELDRPAPRGQRGHSGHPDLAVVPEGYSSTDSSSHSSLEFGNI